MFILLAAIGSAGCSAPPAYQEADFLYFQGQAAALREHYAAAESDPSINALVGVDKLLSAAILERNWAEAERLAELASSRVNIFLANQKGERDALSFLGREKDKPFKGEPYERAMVDFYLGLLRFRRGEYEGALNAFLSALQKDRGAYQLPGEAHRGRGKKKNSEAPPPETYIFAPDWSSLYFFAAVSCQRIDEPEEAQRYLDEAKRLRPDLTPLFDEGMDPKTNTFFFIEGGRAPVKQRVGKRGEVLTYRRGAQAELRSVRLGGAPLRAGVGDDLYAQASTLGGRAVDELNRTKAARQELISTAGLGTAVVGSAVAMAGHNSGNRQLEAAGLIAMAVGAGAMIFAEAAVDPSADIRAWNTLPDRIYIAVGKAPPGETGVEIDASDERGNDLSQRWTGVAIEKEKSTLLWFRLLPSVKGGAYGMETKSEVGGRKSEVTN